MFVPGFIIVHIILPKLREGHFLPPVCNTPKDPGPDRVKKFAATNTNYNHCHSFFKATVTVIITFTVTVTAIVMVTITERVTAAITSTVKVTAIRDLKKSGRRQLRRQLLNLCFILFFLPHVIQSFAIDFYMKACEWEAQGAP